VIYDVLEIINISASLDTVLHLIELQALLLFIFTFAN